ncbi:hypothetical protein NUSPORA_02953 [Nucleospora cyclopteri]
MQLEKNRHTLIIRATILSVGKKIWTHLALIVPYLSNKYNINQQDLEITKLINAQKTNLYNKIKQKYLHSKLYKCAENELVDFEGYYIWLKKGNIKAVDEAALYFLQDRNLFYGEKVNCPYCNSTRKTVDHLATICDRMLSFDYKKDTMKY